MFGQTAAKPAGVITPPAAQVATPAATQTEPLTVNVNLPGTAAITGENLSVNTFGVTGHGGAGGVSGDGRSWGGSFFSLLGTGVEAVGYASGVKASCGAGACVSLSSKTEAEFSTGVYASGNLAVVGVAKAPSFSEAMFSPPYAGVFMGNVKMSAELTVAGPITSPTITQQNALIAALTARIDALEAAAGIGGVRTTRVEAEDYNAGGQSVGYFDLTLGNEGGGYRSDNVDIKPSPDGGFAVGWMQRGEWLAYTVNIPVAGSYTLSARVGSALPDRTFHMELNGTDVTGPVAVPSFPAWDQFAAVTVGTIIVPAGPQTFRFAVDQDWQDSTALNCRAIHSKRKFCFERRRPVAVDLFDSAFQRNVLYQYWWSDAGSPIEEYVSEAFRTVS